MEPTTDNNRGLYEVSAPNLPHIRKIADRKISELNGEGNSNLLIFPDQWSLCEDRIGDLPICSLCDNRLTTGNVMGFVGINGCELTIRSRFAQQDGNDYFLHYMLQKVFSIQMFDLPHASDSESIFDFLLYLFPFYLKKALSQGIYKEYQIRKYNDANVRGVMDVNRHLHVNMPFGGKVAYRTREYCFDNPVTQLIRHTIEYIRLHPFGANILYNDFEMQESVSQIVYATQTYNRKDRMKVLNQNIRPITHPYFREYVPLQKICIQILKHGGMKYGQKEDCVYGLLFDGAWLWEEYLHTVLQACGFKHSRNKKNSKEARNSICLFQEGHYERLPDFYIPGRFILDAKYKHLQKSAIERNDMHQLITYMYVESAPKAGLVYPFEEKVPKDILSQKVGTLRGYGGEVWLFGVPVGKCGSFNAFCKVMKGIEKRLKDSMCERVNNI